jgi:hypothetical protein
MFYFHDMVFVKTAWPVRTRPQVSNANAKPVFSAFLNSGEAILAAGWSRRECKGGL